MKTFLDNAGRTWALTLNVATLKQVRGHCEGVDLMAVLSDGGALLDRLRDDPILLCDVVYALCKEEADARNVSEVDFGRAMAGEAIARATQALLEELTDFFRGRTGRDLFGAVIAKLRQCESLAADLVLKKLEDPAMEARMRAAIERLFQEKDSGGESSSNARGSLPSTPAPSPSLN